MPKQVAKENKAFDIQEIARNQEQVNQRLREAQHHHIPAHQPLAQDVGILIKQDESEIDPSQIAPSVLSKRSRSGSLGPASQPTKRPAVEYNRISFANVMLGKEKKIIPKKVEQFKTVKESQFYGWFPLDPERQINDLQNFISTFPAKLVLQNATPEEEVAGSDLEHNTIFRRQVLDDHIESFYLTPSCIFRTPFSFGSFLDGNILSVGKSDKTVQFGCDLIFTIYSMMQYRGQEPPEFYKNVKILVGQKSMVNKNTDQNIPAFVQNIPKITSNMRTLSQQIIFTTPFVDSPFDVMLSSCLISTADLLAQENERAENGYVGSTLIVLKEALEASFKVFPELKNILLSEMEFYSDSISKDQNYEKRRQYIQVRLDKLVKEMNAVFTPFLAVYTSNFIDVPIDFKGCNKFTDRKIIINFLRTLTSAIRIQQDDYNSLRLVHLESITPGDYCSELLVKDNSKRVHGDMTGGFNGFCMSYIIFETSKEVVMLRSKNQFRQPYTQDADHSLKYFAGSVALKFGCDLGQMVPYYLDTDIFQNVCQNPEHLFLQGLCITDSFYKYSETYFKSKLVTRSYTQQDYELCYATHKDCIKFLPEGGHRDEIIINLKATIKNDIQSSMSGFLADKFFFLLGKNTDFMRPFSLGKKRLDEKTIVAKLNLPYVGTTFQKFNWLQFHKYYSTYFQGMKAQRDHILTDGDLVNFGDIEYQSEMPDEDVFLKAFEVMKIEESYLVQQVKKQEEQQE